MSAMPEPGRYGSGHTVRRIEDPALVTGRGRYADDVAQPGLTHLVFVRSSHAHARINAIDTETARAMPGVLAVVTAADLAAAGVKPLPVNVPFKRADGSPLATPQRHVLATDVLRHVGEPVAFVVAETRDQARAAADAVWVDAEELPAIVDPVRATQGGTAMTPEAPDNITAVAHYGDAAAVAAAFARAAHTVSVQVVNQRLAPTPIEPRCTVAHLDEGRIVIRSSTQMPTAVRNTVADILPGLTPEDVRVLVGDVGGGFGMKTGCYPEDIAVAHAARSLKRPVSWRAERMEEFLSAVHGRDVVSRAEMALDAEGRALALRVRSYANVGAYATNTGLAIQLLVGPWVTTSIYDLPTIDLDLHAVLTNAAPTGAYRGAGRPEAIYLIERLMDAAARKLAMDPAELRRRNMIRPEQMPYANPMGQTYDSGEFAKMLDQCLARADWQGFAARRARSLAAGRLRGRGIATFLEWTGGNALEEKASVNVRADGVIEIVSATMQMGQGIQTSYAQLAHDVFGVPLEKIRIVQGDTDLANGFGSAGSRSLFTGGAAVHAASERTVAHAKDLAAEALEAPAADLEYRAGRFTVAGTDLGVDLFELAKRQPGARIVMDATTTAGAPSWPNGCHICEVEVDPQTGAVEIVKYTSVNDIGRIVSPTIVRGQIEGGAVQGIGQALSECVVYDGETGQMLTASLLDYALPHVDGFLGFDTAFDTSVPCKTNSLGAKGVGELGTIGATPAVVNAVVDALDAAGLGADAERVQMPLTAERVWRALQRDFDPAPLPG